ncbi:MAG: dimethylarginine dimethylaminohydrolase family protein [Candidatus Thorarchaeota archaeon]|jgi:dimethylargininase
MEVVTHKLVGIQSPERVISRQRRGPLTMLGHALVRPPPRTFSRCISSHPEHHKLNLRLARRQHAAYCNVLSELGIEVIVLPEDEAHPDSCFVEDTAVVRGSRAFITRMAKESRRGEEKEILKTLKQYKSAKSATQPATIEGGDIVHLPDRLISGVTKRTNREGVNQMTAWLNVASDLVEDQSIIHLKSHVTNIGKDVILATGAFADHPVLRDFVKVVVPFEERYAANALAIGETVLMSEGHPQTQEMVSELGFDVKSLRMSEFEKCEGALTCLSILF